ncbi:hypothetical protein CUMW_260280, partial [Citrus unshiu]
MGSSQEILELVNLVSLDLSLNSGYGLELQKPNFANLVQKLSNLETLDLGHVSIRSTIPHNLANLSSLTFLSLHSCGLQGRIQSSLGNLSKLLHLDLSLNELLGELPVSIGNLHSLKKLDLSVNNLSGELPTSIQNLLQSLDFTSNKFSGELHAFIGNLRSLEVLAIGRCNFSGRIPSSLRNLTQLITLDLSQNSYRGTMELDFLLVSLKNLEVLSLSSNWLSLLTKVTSNTTSQKFTVVGLRSCNLIEFLNFLKNQHHLMLLDLSSNRIHGKIPSWLLDPSTQNLSALNLSHNLFTGKLPSKSFLCWNAMKIVNTSDLKYLQDVISPKEWLLSDEVATYDYSLTMNNKGKIMTYDKVPDILTGIILSSNRFDGMIPTSIANLKRLQVLNLDNNNLQGHIPSCLGNLTNLESLDLSNNNFLGQIPQQLVELTFLEIFNVSDNYLTGPIPQGRQFSTFDNSSFESNSGLCGRPLSRECESDEDHSKGTEESLFSGAFDWKIILIGYAGGLVVGFVLGFKFSTGIVGWFLEKLRTQQKATRWKRR